MIESISDFSASYEGDTITCKFVVNGVDGTSVQVVKELNYVTT